MKIIKVKGKRESITMAEWSDIKHIVERHLKENKSFYAQLAEM